MKQKHILFYVLFAMFTNVAMTAKAQAVNVQDSLALVDLYNRTDGPNWNNHTNWLTGPVSTWYGVSVTGTSVTQLDLENNNLKGILLASIGNLTSLSNLNLDSNLLSGAIPLTIGKLTQLNLLYLYSNQFSGSIPPGIGNLTMLKDLNLSVNQLTGSIPSSIGNLVNLNANLILAYNQLSGAIPLSIGNLRKVNTIDLSYNQLSGSIPEIFGKLDSLQVLYLFNNNLTGQMPASLVKKFAQLKFCSLNANHITCDINVQGSAKFPDLGLSLLYNNFTFNGMEAIAKSKFAYIYISNQAPVSIHTNSNSLSVYAGGTLSNNTYTWYRAGQTRSLAVITGDSTFQPAQSGMYYANVTNRIATKLTLTTDTINYMMPVTAEIKASYTNNIQANRANNVTGSLSAFPNPVKDILHIQNTGKATVTLTDQSGKILVTKTIINSGEINVSRLPAGLYYLKNNTTCEVQKVVITK